MIQKRLRHSSRREEVRLFAVITVDVGLMISLLMEGC